MINTNNFMSKWYIFTNLPNSNSSDLNSTPYLATVFWCISWAEPSSVFVVAAP